MMGNIVMQSSILAMNIYNTAMISTHLHFIQLRRDKLIINENRGILRHRNVPMNDTELSRSVAVW